MGPTVARDIGKIHGFVTAKVLRMRAAQRHITVAAQANDTTETSPGTRGKGAKGKRQSGLLTSRESVSVSGIPASHSAMRVRTAIFSLKMTLSGSNAPSLTT
jgi:hypothetical protein